MTMQRIDPKVPPSLLSIQKRFARIITSPTGEGAMEAQEFIAPSHNLSSKQRIQIYNEQYWCEGNEIFKVNLPCCDKGVTYYDKNGKYLETCGGGPIHSIGTESKYCQQLLQLKCDKRKFI